MKVVDKRGSWFTNFSQFRMHDPMSDTYFESGEPTKATETAWRQNNKAVIKATDDEGTPIDDPDPVVEEPEVVQSAEQSAGQEEIDPAAPVPPAKVDTAKKK